jgi:ABC-type sugar transport system permease subunit
MVNVIAKLRGIAMNWGVQMKTGNAIHWDFVCVLIALPLQFVCTIGFALAFSVREWFWLQTAMLILLPALVAATVTLSALALRRIGKPLNWVFSAFLFPPLPAIIYAVSCAKSAPAGVRRGSGVTAELGSAQRA